MMEKLIQKIKSARSIILSTHRECDGDGLGAEIALYHALLKMGKDVRVLNYDDVPIKYHFLNHHSFLEVYKRPHSPIRETDLTLIFDTNDERQLETLYPQLKKMSHDVLFIDHHPILKEGPQPTADSFIDISAASTGEIAFNLIKALNIELDELIARSLYTSIAFDTQVFRYVRNSPHSHLIASELLKYNINPEDIHRRLFSTHTAEKITFLSRALGNIEYYLEGRVALLKIKDSDLSDHGLSLEETRDVIDIIMNIESLEAAVIFREDNKDVYKVSLRSKGLIEVLSVAESLGGGGHRWAAGATFKGDYTKLKEITLKSLKEKLEKKNGSTQN